jgi:hypothetical protein
VSNPRCLQRERRWRWDAVGWRSMAEFALWRRSRPSPPSRHPRATLGKGASRSRQETRSVLARYCTLAWAIGPLLGHARALGASKPWSPTTAESLAPQMATLPPLGRWWVPMPPTSSRLNLRGASQRVGQPHPAGARFHLRMRRVTSTHSGTRPIRAGSAPSSSAMSPRA